MSYKESKVYKAHLELGFPAIEETVQYDILVNRDYEPIINLIPALRSEGFPLGLLKHYITITREQLKEHLRKVNFIAKQLECCHPTSDGIFLKREGLQLVLIERERGIIFNRTFYNSQAEVLEFYVNLLGWCCK